MKEINETITELRDHARHNQMDCLLIKARKLVTQIEDEHNALIDAQIEALKVRYKVEMGLIGEEV